MVMNMVKEEDLAKVSGGEIGGVVKSDDILKYIQVMSKRPGIVDRFRSDSIDDEDIKCVESYFASVDRFAAVAAFAGNKTTEELMAIAAANEK